MSRATRSLTVTESADRIELRSPGVGIFAPSVAPDDLVSAGQLLGFLETLGVSQELRVPSGVAGRVRSRAGDNRTRVPVEFGEVLVSLSSTDLADENASQTKAEADSGTLAFLAPMSGRFYVRPSPEEPPFVSPGDTVTVGQTVGLLEVMKTFNRLVYQGEGLPHTARVVAVVPADGDDVTRGEPILRLDSAAGG